MDEIKPIIEDKREISAIGFNISGGSFWEVGKRGLEKIVAYAENGSLGSVPYLAVYRKGQVEIKLAAHMVTIHYTLLPQNDSQEKKE